MRKLLFTALLAIAAFTILSGDALAATLVRPANNLGLVGWWTLDQGTSTRATDSSGYGNNGTLFNFAAPATVSSGWTTYGKRGGAMLFDGTNDTIQVPHGASMKPSSTMTVSAWVKPDVGSLSSAIREIYRKEDAQRHLFSFQMPAGQCATGTGVSTCISFGIVVGGTYSEFDVPITASDFEGRWRLVTAVYDGTNRYMYFDGVLASSTPTTGAIGTSGTNSAYIGSNGGGGEWFKGAIDDLRVYSRALSASEVEALYSTGAVTRKTANNTDLFGSWTFDEGTSTVAHDFSGNGRNGTLNGFPAVSTVSSGWALGKRGNGLVFDGTNDYVEVANTLSDIGTGSFTSAAWFRASNTGITWKRVMHTGCVAYTNGMFMARWNASGQMAAAVCNGSAAANSFVPVTTATYLDGRWHHMAFVVDRVAGTARIYIDGVNVTIQKNISGTECGTLSGDSLYLDISACPSATVAGGNLRLGANSTGGERWDGLIDDAKLYSRALSASEISGLYSQGAATIGVTTDKVSSGLVGYWSFNGKDMDWSSNTAYDRSGYGINGIGTAQLSATTSPVAGRVGQALSFTGANGLDMPVTTGSIGALTNAISMSLWVKRGDDGTFRNIAGVTKDDSTTSYSWGFRVNNTNNVFFDVFVSGFRLQVGDPSVVPVGTWAHYTFTWDGANLILYKNGVLTSSTTRSGTLDPYNTKQFGISNTGGYSRFVGSIDEVRVYNRALSAAEAKQLYLMGK